MLARLPVAVFRYGTRLARALNRRLTPAGNLLAGGGLASISFGMDVRQTAALQVASMMFGLLLVSCLFLLRGRPAVTVRRILPPFATAGVPLTYSLQIENLLSSTDAHELHLQDQLDSRLPDAAAFTATRDPAGVDSWLERLFGLRRWLRLMRATRGGNVLPTPPVSLVGGSSATLGATLMPLRRGYLHFESTVVKRPDPLGLINAVTELHHHDALLVLPRRYRVPKLIFGGARRHQPGGLHRASSVGDSSEFLALRDYVSGDPRRHIHWRSWAHTGKPIVRQFEDQYLSRQALIVDTCIDTHGQAKRVDTTCFEAAISLAASFVTGPQAADSVVDLMFIGSRAVHAQAGRSLGAQARLLELLACAEPAQADQIATLNRVVQAQARQISGAIVILLAWDAPRQALVQTLRERRVPVAVIVVDDSPATRPDPGPMRDQPRSFCVVHPDRVEQDIAGLVAPMPASAGMTHRHSAA
jgi:uncharacterized protein (DUF58 family)